MSGITYGWLGASRRDILVAHLDRLIPVWLADWCARERVGESRVLVAAEWPNDTNLATLAGFRSAAGASGVLVRGHRHGLLGRWLMDLQDDDGVGVAETLASGALNDLSRRIHAEASGIDVASVIDVGEGTTRGAFRASAGALHAQVQLGRVDVDILLDRQLCAMLAPPPVVSRAPVVPRSMAVSHVAFRLDATLDFGRASLGDLSNLQVGELLVSDTPLTRLVDLCLEDGKPIVSGRLSRADASLALRLQTSHE